MPRFVSPPLLGTKSPHCDRRGAAPYLQVRLLSPRNFPGLPTESVCLRAGSGDAEQLTKTGAGWSSRRDPAL